MTLKINDKEYPVTAKFRAMVLDPHPDLAAAPYGNLEAQKNALLDLSTARNAYQAPPIPEDMETDVTGNLTAEEALRLANIVHVMNCHHAVNFLAGRDHGEFGFDGIDQVHGNKITHPCGCQTTHVFDHYQARAENPGELQLHPHFSKAWCARHKHRRQEFRAHYEAVRADPANTAANTNGK
jgi:hypothetical protein